MALKMNQTKARMMISRKIFVGVNMALSSETKTAACNFLDQRIDQCIDRLFSK